VGETATDTNEIDSDLFRLYSQVLVIASTLSRAAVHGDDMCTYPEADALELAAEFVGTATDEGLYGRLEQMARDVYMSGCKLEVVS